jgi:hypothetical protein
MKLEACSTPLPTAASQCFTRKAQPRSVAPDEPLRSHLYRKRSIVNTATTIDDGVDRVASTTVTTFLPMTCKLFQSDHSKM